MDEDWSITTGGGSIVCSQICKRSPLVIYNKKFHEDLIVIGNLALDVILGMDWLGSTYTIIDYWLKKAIFSMPK